MRIRNNHKGQSLVEFALILPLLLLLILGAIDIGRIITTKIAVTNAAREGANFLSRNVFWDEEANQDDIDATFDVIMEEGQSISGSIVNVSIESEDIDINLGSPPDCCTKGEPVDVTVTKEVDLIFGNILQFLGGISGPITISSSIQMRVQ